jgi:predicted nucleotidyltransferase
MNENLPDLSEKIDAFLVEILEAVTRIADSIDVPFFVVGATARDIVLMHAYGIRSLRATKDIDLAVQVSNWDQYNILREALKETGQFTDCREPQRLLFKETWHVDVIPFGNIEKPGHSIFWPPDQEVEMDTLGFEEAYRCSLMVKLKSDPIFEARFASLAGLAVMKIISWDEKYPLRKKDALDLSLIAQYYLDAGNRNRLFDKESDLVEIDDFDYVLASARLLGRDIAAMSGQETREAILEILNRETREKERYRLTEDMMEPDRAGDSTQDFDERLKLLEALKGGVLDRI